MALHRRNVIKLGGALVVALSLALSGAQLLAQSGKVEVHWLVTRRSRSPRRAAG